MSLYYGDTDYARETIYTGVGNYILNELWKQEYKLMQKFTLIEKTVMYRCFADAKWIII